MQPGEVTKYEPGRELHLAAAELLGDLERLIVKHHDIGKKQEWGGLCTVCVPGDNDPAEGIFPRLRLIRRLLEQCL